MRKNVTCNNCGWVHFAVTRAHAKTQSKEFADFWNAASIDTKLCYFKLGTTPAELPKTYDADKHFARYTSCFQCGESYKNFRESKEDDCPIGCTIQPILDYKEFDCQEGLSV